MSHPLTTKISLLILAIAILPLSFANAQSTPEVAPVQNFQPDPATDADFYLDKAAVKIAELQTFVESIRGKTGLRQYPFRPVVFSKRDTNQAFEILKLAKVQIDLVSDNTNTDRRRRHQRLSRQAVRLSTYLTRIRTSLLASLNPKAFPDLKADAARFRGIGTMFANIASFESDPQLAATLLQQLPAAQQEANRIIAKYDLLIQQETIAGLQLVGLKRYFDSKRKSFEAIVKQQQQVLPERIKKNLSVASKALLSPSERRLVTSESIEEQKKQVELHRLLRKIEAEINLSETIDPQSSASLRDLRQQLVDLKVAVRKIEPADVYVGEDRDDLTKLIMFTRSQPGVVNIRIPSKKWKRRTYWRFDGVQWLAIDRSILQAYLLATEANDASAGWQGFLLEKDHLNKDAITVRRDE